MEYKAAPGYVKEISDRTVVGIASVFGVLDDGRDVVWPGAFTKTLKENARRVRHLWQHRTDEPPVAVVKALREVGRGELPPDLLRDFPDASGGLEVVREYLPTPRGEEVLQGIKSGAIGEMSFGYDAIKRDYESKGDIQIRNLREVRLWETSDVQWGMNPATRAAKGALPFHESPKEAEDAPWDGPAEVAQAEVSDLKLMCAWVDPDNADQKGGYKLPHHRAGGSHAVVWRGVAGAMAALMGGRGGVDIPAADRRAVYDHLARHYAQFDKEPPDFKMIELAATARRLILTMPSKEGRVISASNMARLKQIIASLENSLETLEELLQAAEPPSSEGTTEKTLTARRAILARLAIAEREVIQWR